MSFFTDRLRRFSKAHIYHYAAYEVTALRRLTASPPPQTSEKREVGFDGAGPPRAS